MMGFAEELTFGLCASFHEPSTNLPPTFPQPSTNLPPTFPEALTFALCAANDCFNKLRIADDGRTAAVIANPKTEDFQVCRTSLLPGLLKTLAKNRSNALPWR